MRDHVTIAADVVYHKVQRQRIEYVDGRPPSNWSYPSAHNTSFDVSIDLVRKARGDLRVGNRVTPTGYEGHLLNVTPGTLDNSVERWVGRTYTSYGVPFAYLIVERYYTGNWAHLPTSWFVKERTLTGNPYTPEAVESGAEASAINRVRDSKVDLALNLGELHESYGLMADTLRRAALAYGAARRKDWRSVKRHLGLIHWTHAVEELGNQWLAYRYGWRPLMGDLYNFREKIMSSFRQEGAQFMAVGFREETHEPWEDLVLDFTQSGSARHGCTVKYRFRITDTQLAFLESLGFANPIAFAWELTSHSFVVDWFFSVGDFLRGLGDPLGTEFVDGFKTRYVYEDYEFGPKGEPYQLSSKCRSEAFGFKRDVLLSYPKPSPYISLGLDPTRSMDAVQLLRPKG